MPSNASLFREKEI